MVQGVVDSDVFQIVTVEPYPCDYEETTDLALEEQKADYLDGLVVQGVRAEDAQDDVDKWLKQIGIVD
ncbi:hypothetical protein GCM10010912_50940 [Paenibacillus albidus]|uniref:Uncharacterized protein n=1 Tax=Paenibacillus albidus TaxID=2041023 RepID=A0A917FT87_9BACL|nr:hypothetical protein [Paenibacillus albidus]GGF99921.1 hypothetical protein GCM10010912_50940 [Paenibacillus albidus]